MTEPPNQPQAGPGMPGQPPYPGPPPTMYPIPPQEMIPQRPKTSAWAVAGFVFGLGGGVVLAPIFSIIGLRRIKRLGQRGRGFAVAGLVLSGLWAALIAVLASLGFYGGGAADLGDTTAVSNIRVGQCFDADLARKTLLVATIADCAVPHAGEAYAKVTADLGGVRQDEKDLAATQECAAEFEVFVGRAYADSDLDVLFVVLDDEPSDDGNVLCMLAQPGSELTGSMRGSRR
jgi:hypothetical protein